MGQGGKAVGARCWQRLLRTHSNRVTRRRSVRVTTEWRPCGSSAKHRVTRTDRKATRASCLTRATFHLRLVVLSDPECNAMHESIVKQGTNRLSPAATAAVLLIANRPPPLCPCRNDWARPS